MILGTKYPLLFGFFPMILYFIELLHPWKITNNYSVTLIALYNGHSCGKWTSMSENVLFYNAIEQTPLS